MYVPVDWLLYQYITTSYRTVDALVARLYAPLQIPLLRIGDKRRPYMPAPEAECLEKATALLINTCKESGRLRQLYIKLLENDLDPQRREHLTARWPEYSILCGCTADLKDVVRRLPGSEGGVHMLSNATRDCCPADGAAYYREVSDVVCGYLLFIVAVGSSLGPDAPLNGPNDLLNDALRCCLAHGIAVYLFVPKFFQASVEAGTDGSMMTLSGLLQALVAKANPLVRVSGYENPVDLMDRIQDVVGEAPAHRATDGSGAGDVTQVEPASYSDAVILQVGDLHLGDGKDQEAVANDLADSIAAGVEEMRGASPEETRIPKVDFLVVCGDLSQEARVGEFWSSVRFIERLKENLSIKAGHCVVVPGNHDVDWTVDVFRWKRCAGMPLSREGELLSGKLVQAGEAHYASRFCNFADIAYYSVCGEAYPLDPKRQFLVSTFPQQGIEFWSFNSAWEVDELNTERAGINAGAWSSAEQFANRRCHDRSCHHRSHRPLRIAVWHHPLDVLREHGQNGSMPTNDLVERMLQAGVKLHLHGHMHHERRGVTLPTHGNRVDRAVHGIGTGFVGAQDHQLPAGTPRLVDIVWIKDNRGVARVITLRRTGPHGVWKPHSVWLGQDGREKDYYDIQLNL